MINASCNNRAHVFEVTQTVLSLTMLLQDDALQVAAEWFEEVRGEKVQLIAHMTHVFLMIAGTAGGGGAKGRDEGCADGDGQRAAEGRPSPRLGCVAPDHPDGDGGAHRVGRGDDLEAQEELR